MLKNFFKSVSRCNSITNEGKQCKKRKIPFGRYCYLHTEKTNLFLTFIVGLALGFLFFFLGDRHPNILVSCSLNENADPHILKCLAENKGRKESKDIYISFLNQFPANTKIVAEPQYAISIDATNEIINPNFSPKLAEISTAFRLHIPRVSARSKIKFEVFSDNKGNIQAGKQLLKINEETSLILEEFGKNLKEKYSNESEYWKIEDIKSSRLKEINFFSPGKFSYEKGQFEVDFFSSKEIKASAVNQDIYKKYKKEFIEIFQNRPSFSAPVVNILKTNSNTTFIAIYPPYVKTCLSNFAIIDVINKTDSTEYVFEPRPPKIGYDETCDEIKEKHKYNPIFNNN